LLDAVPWRIVAPFARRLSRIVAVLSMIGATSAARSGAPDQFALRYPKEAAENVKPAASHRVLRTNGALTFRLASGNDTPDGQPNAWAYVPSRFDPASPLHVIVLFHGFKNCIASYTSRGGQACSNGGPARTGYDLANQMERAESGAILVVPEIAFDQPLSSDPGKLGEPGGLRAFLTELLDEALAPYIGQLRSTDIERLALMASSGGYQALVPALQQGGEKVTDVYMLDACYVYKNSPVGDFLFTSPDDFDPARSHTPRRFGVVYSHGAGAFAQSERMRLYAEDWLTANGRDELGFFSTKKDEPRLDDFRAPVFLIYSHLMHDVIVQRYFWRVVRASGL